MCTDERDEVVSLGISDRHAVRSLSASSNVRSSQSLVLERKGNCELMANAHDPLRGTVIKRKATVEQGIPTVRETIATRIE